MKLPKELIEFENVKEVDIIQKYCVYFLYNFHELVYIGKSDTSINARIVCHLKDKIFTDAYYIEFFTKELCQKKERELILKYQPKYNLMWNNDYPQKGKESIKFNAPMLKNILNERKMSYVILAQKIKSSYSRITYIINKGTTNVETINDIAKALKVSPKDILL